MARNYRHTLFDDAIKAMQERHGSRAPYLKMDAGADGTPDALTAKELDYIALRDSFYIASVTADGWPYMQHRGGPAGFLSHIAGNRIGFADYRGNRQYISTANLSVNVESTNRKAFCGLRRKSAVNDARYLRDDWKTPNGPKRGCPLTPALSNAKGSSHG